MNNVFSVFIQVGGNQAALNVNHVRAIFDLGNGESNIAYGDGERDYISVPLPIDTVLEKLNGAMEAAR